jgi:xylulose-5-phosphate/fructose-6-phosphate phosphoketolase
VIDVEGSDLPGRHRRFAAAVAMAYQMIMGIQRSAWAVGRLEVRPRWPVIILRSPKGWTGPAQVDGTQVVGTRRSHQVPLAGVRETKIICDCWRSRCSPIGPRSCSTRGTCPAALAGPDSQFRRAVDVHGLAE